MFVTNIFVGSIWIGFKRWSERSLDFPNRSVKKSLGIVELAISEWPNA